MRNLSVVFGFFFNDTATTEIYTLSLHDALPICTRRSARRWRRGAPTAPARWRASRSEEHTSELQSRGPISYAVFCLKKNKTNSPATPHQHPRRSLHPTPPPPRV